MVNDILVVGGYGVVGARVATILHAWNPGRVVVAGRNPPAESPLPTRPIDLDEPATIRRALDGVSTVVACVRQRAPHLLEAAIDLGIAYTSIAASWTPDLGLLPTRARDSGARVVLATGIEPGISSVLAGLGADRVGAVEEIETFLLLSVGDVYGADSMAFMVEELRERYEIKIQGESQPTKPFQAPKRVEFPDPIGERTAYTMPFRDQLHYPRTLGARTAIARLALDPAWVTGALARAAQLGLGRAGGGAALNNISQRLRRRYAGSDVFALVVDVRSRRLSARSTLIGHGQAAATAVSAAATAQALIAGEVDLPGVFLPEEILPVAPFLARLAEHGLHPQIGEARERRVDQPWMPTPLFTA